MYVENTSTSTLLSVEEARKLMPDTTKNMSDKDVIGFIESLELLAESIIKMVQQY